MSKEVLHGFSCEFVHEGNSCKLVDILKAENAKLRTMRDTWAENDAKLRELVRGMWDGMCDAHDCRSCEHYELHEGHRFVGECEFHRRMREMEVIG